MELEVIKNYRKGKPYVKEEFPFGDVPICYKLSKKEQKRIREKQERCNI